MNSFAFTDRSPAPEGKVDNQFEEPVGQKSVFIQVNILSLDLAPQDKVPMVPHRFMAEADFAPAAWDFQPTPKEFSIRDQKYSLTILIHPFFFFW